MARSHSSQVQKPTNQLQWNLVPSVVENHAGEDVNVAVHVPVHVAVHVVVHVVVVVAPMKIGSATPRVTIAVKRVILNPTATRIRRPKRLPKVEPMASQGGVVESCLLLSRLLSLLQS